ncbi:MAG: universal stress protein [Ramlibacter sp.]|nr:universal stress protein [Ramlibacter sp.]
MYERILVPLDGSETSHRALAAALGLAQSFKAHLRLIHVLDEGAYLARSDPYGGYTAEVVKVMREAGEQVLRVGLALAKAAGVEADSMLFDKFSGRLGENVAQAAKLWNADLLVVGTHGRRGVSRLLLGSGAEQIIRLAPVPVLVIRDPETAAA